jgi:hypothetical protein
MYPPKNISFASFFVFSPGFKKFQGCWWHHRMAIYMFTMWILEMGESAHWSNNTGEQLLLIVLPSPQRN